MDIFDKNNNKFSMRIFFLAEKNGDPNKIKCKKCEKKFTSFNYKINDYNENCKVCFFTLVDHYPTKGYFKKKFGDEWEKYYKKDRETIPNLKVNSKEWFKGKFGEELGIKKYEDFLEKKIKKLENLKTKKYSKISQKLFWLIYEKLNPEEKEKCWFKELNKELYIKVNQTKYYFPDFLMGEKIIEYDGKYWHNQNEDNLRNYLYNQNGFEVMVITEDDFSRETKNNEVVYKCLKFLRNET